MENTILKLQNTIEDFIKTKANGIILNLGNDFRLYYIKTLVDTNFITRDIQKVYFDKTIDFDSYFKSLAHRIHSNETIESIKVGLIKGDIISIYKNQLFKIIGAEKIESRGVPEVEREASFEGGMEGFNEVSLTNVNLVTQYYRQPTLVVKNFTVGTVTHNTVALLYDSNYVDENLLKEITDRLNNINVPAVQALNGLQQLLWKNQLLIPRMLVTQRPDRVTSYLTKGKIVLFLDGTATALIIPVQFHDFIKTVDDEYLLPIPALFLIILRYLALILSIMLPSTYVAIVSYNPEILRIQLSLSISSSRSGVPYPSFIEVFIMLLLMEFLVEASIRLPKSIGQTATTVGGLILGQAAIQAHLVSNIMIIIVSTVAISNFMIPAISMNLSVRVAKYGLLFLVSFTGVYGIYLGLYCLTCYMFSIKTFNVPYFNPIEDISIKGFKSFFRKGSSDEV